MDTNVKNNILKYEYEVQSTKEKISCNKYEPKITLEDKVYPKSITNINQGNVAVDETSPKIKTHGL